MKKQIHGEFKTAGDALKTLGQAFNDWSSILTTHSIHAAYAIIAANWAVHGSTQNILNNSYAKWSLVIVFVFLGFNILVSGCMKHMHFNQYLHGEKNSKKWETEFKEYEKSRQKGKRTPWPYTECIENLGVAQTFVKICAPIIAATLFIFSLFS